MRREIKLIILMFLLIVGPAVLLSLLAARVLNNWQVVLQKRMEGDAIRVLDQAVAEWEGELRRVGGKGTGIQNPESRIQNLRLRGWVEGIFVWEGGVGLVYPRAESAVTSFVPPAVMSDSSRKAATLLQQATAFSVDGATNQARECLVKVVAVLEGARDPEEGFYYDLIALKKLADHSSGREKEAFTHEILRHVLERYDELVPLQRELMVEWVEREGKGSQYSVFSVQKPESENRTLNTEYSLLSAWRERMRGRSLTKTDRGRIAAEISTFAALLPKEGWVRGRVGGQDAMVGRDEIADFRGKNLDSRSPPPAGGSGVTSEKSGGRRIVAIQFSEQRLIEHLNQRFITIATNSGIKIRVQVAGGRSLNQKASIQYSESSIQSEDPRSLLSEHRTPNTEHFPLAPLLASRRLPIPLESISLEAGPADPLAFSENARLQSRLYRWGGVLLVISVAAGAWLIWRQASVEIREARERTDFAATVSHDLRTPLASMRMLAESLYLGNIGDEAKKRTFLGAIIKESDRLSRLTDRALYFIRYGQGALRYQFTEGDLGSLVKDVVETFAVGVGGDVKMKSAECRLKHDEGGRRKEEGGATPQLNNSATVSRAVSILVNASNDLPLVRFDDGAMEQVVFNLLDNAVKYTEKGKAVSIEVSVTARSPHPPLFRWVKSGVREVAVSVKDHGTGMARDEIRRVMKPYMRGSGAARQNARGVGLGLALCHHVVNAHGGRIEVESVPGSGTTFSIILPAAG